MSQYQRRRGRCVVCVCVCGGGCSVPVAGLCLTSSQHQVHMQVPRFRVELKSDWPVSRWREVSEGDLLHIVLS